jgi:glycerol uptake facilitator protein
MIFHVTTYPKAAVHNLTNIQTIIRTFIDGPCDKVERMARSEPSLGACCLAEILGTFLLVFFGCGAVHSAVLTGAQSGLWQVAIVWGVAITITIYICGGISGAHINPAMTIAFACWGGFPFRRVFPYIGSQLLGAILAAGTLFIIYQPQLKVHEETMKVQRGQPGSEATAMCYGEYFPNPGSEKNRSLYKEQDSAQLVEMVPLHAAFIAEVLGTLILALAVFAVIDSRNHVAPPAALAPVFIGLTVAILISVIAPLTQACFNPARDFGPRLFAATLGGWGKVAFPGPNGLHCLTVYLLAPIAGAILGGGLYQLALRPSLASSGDVPPGPERPS